MTQIVRLDRNLVSQYCAQLYITKLVKEWKADLVVTKDPDSCLTVTIVIIVVQIPHVLNVYIHSHRL